MSCDLLPVALRYLREINAKNVLVVGQGADSVAQAYRTLQPGCAITAGRSTDANTAERYHAAILIGCIEYMEKGAALALIARMRDQYAASLLVIVPIGPEWKGLVSEWREPEFLGLGMQVYAKVVCEAGIMRCYRYDIHDYKQVPDWLNSKYWAHPERWEP